MNELDADLFLKLYKSVRLLTAFGENILQITLVAFSERFSEENAVEGEFILILLCTLLVSH